MRGQSRQAAAASFDSGLEGWGSATVSRGAGWLVGGRGVSAVGGGGRRADLMRRDVPSRRISKRIVGKSAPSLLPSAALRPLAEEQKEPNACSIRFLPPAIC